MASLLPVLYPLIWSATRLKHTVWGNERGGSTLYCRPIRFSFEKETKDALLSEAETLKNEIVSLHPARTVINNAVIHIHHEVRITMIDGKVHTVLSNSTALSQR